MGDQSTEFSALERLLEERRPGLPVDAVERVNLRLVDRAYRLLFANDFAAFAECLDDEIEFVTEGPEGLAMNGREIGKAAVLAAVERNFSLMEEQHAQFVEVEAIGEMVSVMLIERGRFRGMDKEYLAECRQIQTIRGGRVVRMWSNVLSMRLT